MFVEAPGGVLLTVRVIPRARRSMLAGTREGALLVRLCAAPVDGAANVELIEVIAETLDVPKRAITIASGERARRKTLLLGGVSVDGVRASLARAGVKASSP